MQQELQIVGGTKAAPATVPWRVPVCRFDSCRYSPPFPALPTTVVRLSLLLDSYVVDLAAVLAVVRTDPGFTAEIMRLANRRHDAPFSLQTSLIELGMKTLRRAARIVPPWTQSLRDDEMYRLRLRLRKARLVALASEAISTVLSDVQPEKAYVAGLLHDLPSMVCLRQNCACTSPEYSPSMDTWNLPDYIAETMHWHQQPEQATPEHFALVQRVGAARAWASEILYTGDPLDLGWLQKLSQHSAWRYLPDRTQILSTLCEKLNYWRMYCMD